MDVEREIDILKDKIHTLEARIEDIKPFRMYIKEQEDYDEEDELLRDMERED